ncbi:hypothetical protein BC830DRAFT_1175806 [Chytriomyces sp. MP71]|nr:hypothetical protein BC830DRAFT_1175806 [Chytriomyces sp. MP71]
MDHLLRQRYRESLAELTFNSRPIITSLTIIAGENAAHAHVIVAVIEDQLRNVAPNAKLPVLYLIDSICKNIGPVYTHLFSPRMFENFSAAYSVVAPLDREKFRKVVNTWKQPDPRSQGRPLFGREVEVDLSLGSMFFAAAI